MNYKSDFHYLYENLPFQMEAPVRPSIPDNWVNIRDFGGVGDGIVLNTEAFRSAIAALTTQGGGHLVVPEGIWLTGPVTLESNIDFHITPRAMVLFSPDKDLYNIVDTVFEGLDTRRCISPVNADGAVNVSITGGGTIDGSGDAWRSVRRGKATDAEWERIVASGGFIDEKDNIWYPDMSYFRGYKMCGSYNVPQGLESDDEWEDVKTYLRPVLVSFKNCTNVLLENILFQNSPSWNIHPLMCKNVIINNITVRNPWYAKNSDGLDIDSCEGVVVTDSTFDVGNDAICLKSGRDEDGRRRGRPCRNVIIDNCTAFHGYGGFVIGSEMSGGVYNVSVSGCSFFGTDAGLRFKSCLGRGGVVENIHIRDIVMHNIQTEPLLFDMYYRRKYLLNVDNTAIPVFRNIKVKNIICRGASRAMYINGIPDSNISDVLIEDCVIFSGRGAEIRNVSSLVLKNISVCQKDGNGFTFSGCPDLEVTGCKDANGNIAPVQPA